MNADEIGNLLAKVALADRQAFRELYSATSAKLFGVGMSVLLGHSLFNSQFWDEGDVHGQGSPRDSTQAACSAPR